MTAQIVRALDREYEAGFVSISHGEKEINDTLEAAKIAFKTLSKEQK